jgi:hypothetical protein
MTVERPPDAQITATGLDLSRPVALATFAMNPGKCMEMGVADAPMPVSRHSLGERMSMSTSWSAAAFS